MNEKTRHIAAALQQSTGGPARAGREAFLIGLIGKGIGRSLSPHLHETEARALGLDLHYRLIDTGLTGLEAADMPNLLEALQLTGFQGSNITYPFKEVIAGLVELSDTAREIGAVNTIVRNGNGGWVGHNTDWYGFTESFRRDLSDVRIDNVLLVGAGGAGNAIADGMLRYGVTKLAIFDVDQQRATTLVQKLAQQFGANRVEVVTDLSQAMAKADGLIHATPIGMHGNPGIAVPPELIEARLWVADIVYFPLETELLKVARARGCRTLDGIGMVVFQAAEAFHIFTGVVPDVDRMRGDLRDHILRGATI